MSADGAWAELPYAGKLALIARLGDQVASRRRALWHPYPWQVPPAHIPAHGMWLQLGGRGTGKTDGSARYVTDHVRGPACDPRLPGGHRIGIVAPTLGDAADSCVNGPSGLKAHDPSVVLRHTMGGSYVRWPNGAEAKLFGTDTPNDIERLRSGGNRCLFWLEEAAAMRHLGPALAHSAFGLRIGPTPHFVASTTPKPRKELRKLMADPSTIIARGRTAEAIHLDPAVRAALFAAYGGTRLGRQELEGELLDDVEGALWTWEEIDASRVHPGDVPELTRIAVAVDPAVSVTETSDEMGLIAGGTGTDGHVYILADRSAKDAGATAARRVWQLWADVGASVVVYESNQGKKWVGDVLAQVWRQMQTEGILPPGAPPLTEVNATLGKRLRADPVASMYEAPAQVHHVGALEQLEDQMTTWVPESGESPDRLDALVHLVTHLANRSNVMRIVTTGDLPRSAFTQGPSMPGLTGTRSLRR